MLQPSLCAAPETRETGGCVFGIAKAPAQPMSRCAWTYEAIAGPWRKCV